MDFEECQQYLQRLGHHLHVGDWQLHLTQELYESDARAGVWVNHHKDRVQIWICPGFLDFAPEVQREVLTHELLHVHMARMRRAITQLVEQFPDNPAIHYAATRQGEEEEIIVDHLARLLAPSLPLPGRHVAALSA